MVLHRVLQGCFYVVSVTKTTGFHVPRELEDEGGGQAIFKKVLHLYI